MEKLEPIFPLPQKGEKVPKNNLLVMAIVHDKDDIVKVLESDMPTVPFTSDGCSFWPDSWLGKDLYPACFWHDVRYWSGHKGDRIARLNADIALMNDILIITNDPNMAQIMFTGVRTGGSPSWGHGRED